MEKVTEGTRSKKEISCLCLWCWYETHRALSVECSYTSVSESPRVRANQYLRSNSASQFAACFLNNWNSGLWKDHRDMGGRGIHSFGMTKKKKSQRNNINHYSWNGFKGIKVILKGSKWRLKSIPPNQDQVFSGWSHELCPQLEGLLL